MFEGLEKPNVKTISYIFIYIYIYKPFHNLAIIIKGTSYEGQQKLVFQGSDCGPTTVIIVPPKSFVAMICRKNSQPEQALR